MNPLLVIILVIAVGGLAFSGYLSYRELFASVPVECAPVSEPGTILGAPTCVYGFFMYLAIVVMATFALLRRRTAGRTMDRAFRSAFASLRATSARTALALVLVLSGAARGDDDVPDSPEIVIVPIECAQFWSIPGGASSPAAWDAALSFAACIQDASVYRVEHEEHLAGFVEQLQAALAPALQLYVEAIEKAPDRVKLRAVYYVGLGQVALMTRARSSIASPALRAPLESLLEPHAKLAYLLFTAVDRAATSDPELASDVVSRNMVRSARELAASLRTRWPGMREDDPSLLALTR